MQYNYTIISVIVLNNMSHHRKLLWYCSNIALIASAVFLKQLSKIIIWKLENAVFKRFIEAKGVNV